MAARSKAFIAGVAVPTSPGVVLTAAADRVLLVKRVILSNSSGAGTVVIELRYGATAVSRQLYVKSVLWANPLDIDTWFVLNPGASLYAVGDVAGGRISAFGAELVA